MNEITSQELEAAVAKNLESESLFDFDGQNCNDYDDNVCTGWDGQSRRCECGNRRVGWEAYRRDSGEIYVYGVAY